MPPLIIAHRGDSAHRPENTLAAFASALEVGAEFVEFDVQLTGDGHPVVIHDVTLERTTNGHGDLRRMTLAELRACSAGYPEKFGARYAGERVPTLVEALAFLRGRARVMVEIKTESVAADAAAEGGIEELVLGAVRRLGMDREIAVISFNRRALGRCRRFAPDIQRGHLFHAATPDEVVQGAREVGCELVMPHKDMLSDELIARAREAKLKVATWVVDDPAELFTLARYDLFGVGSNCPGVLLDAIADAR